MRQSPHPARRFLPLVGWASMAALLVVAPAASAKKRKRRGPRAPVHKVDACQILTPKIAQIGGAPADVKPRPPSKYGFSPHPRCTYEWAVPDREAKEKAYVAAMMKQQSENIARMQRGEKRAPSMRPPVLNNHIGISWLTTASDAKSAEAEFAQALAMMQKGITTRVDIKGGRAKVHIDKDVMDDDKQKARARVLEKQAERSLVPAGKQLGDRTIEKTVTMDFVPVLGLGDEAAWVPRSGALLVRQGAQRFTIDAQVAPYSQRTQAGYNHEDDPNFTVAQKVARALMATKR